MQVELIKGGTHTDERGKLSFNNDFDATQVRRFYCIENRDVAFQRGWQGHTTEQRWFSAIQGSFKVKVIQVDDWEKPLKELQAETFVLSDQDLDVLYVPKGHITCLQALEENSKLLVMADHLLGEVNDEYRFPLDYFNQKEI